jgi:hypothetical protein
MAWYPSSAAAVIKDSPAEIIPSPPEPAIPIIKSLLTNAFPSLVEAQLVDVTGKIILSFSFRRINRFRRRGMLPWFDFNLANHR